MRVAKKQIRYHCDDIIKKRFQGQGVGVAIFDTGISMHPELKGQILSFYDAINGRVMPYDDNGHGTHVCGIIVGKNIGISPKARAIVCKVLDGNGGGKVYHTMDAIRWVLEHQSQYNIRIVNISAGMSKDTDRRDEERIIKGVEMLWDMGLVVVAAAGNKGPREGTITIPGVSKKIITVGALPNVRARRQYSGRGPTSECVCKPDLLAPGTSIYSCNAFYRRGNLYVPKSGTSMATPIVSGAIATLLSKYPDMSNVEVKLRLRQSCTDLQLPQNQQGWGLLNVEKLLEEK